MSIATTVELPE